MAKTKKVEGFHTNLLSLTRRGVETRATVLFLSLLLLIGYNSTHLLSSDDFGQLIAVSMVQLLVLVVAFTAYDILYNAIVKRYPVGYNTDRLVLIGSQIVLAGMIVGPIVLSWFAGDGSILTSSFLLGEVLVGIFASVILAVRLVGGVLAPKSFVKKATSTSKKRSTTKKKR